MWKARNERRQYGLRVRRIEPTPMDKIDNNLVSAQIDFKLETKTPLFIWGGYGRGDPKQIINKLYSSFPSEKAKLERFLKNVVYEHKRAIEKIDRMAKSIPREFYSVSPHNTVIPSSSIKGAVRSRLEHLFRAQDDSVGCCYCIPKRSRTPPSPYFRSLYSPSHRSKCELTDDRTKACVVCNIFGAQGLASHVRFSDATPEGKLRMEYFKVRPSKHRQFEIPIKAVAPASCFKFNMHCQNLKLEEVGLVFMAMRLHEGKSILMGSYKYVSKETNKGNQKFGEVIIMPLSVQTFKVDRGLVVSQRQDTASFVSECIENTKKTLGKELRTLDEVAMKK